jgi:hypothetical protein
MTTPKLSEALFDSPAKQTAIAQSVHVARFNRKAARAELCAWLLLASLAGAAVMGTIDLYGERRRASERARPTTSANSTEALR